jgi:hypothetical protein
MADSSSNGSTPAARTHHETVTPERAAGWLKNMRNPRPVSRYHVTNLAEQMKRGDWHYNGDPIRLNEKGQLIDGQHRLHAIVLSGISQKMLVLEGISNEAFATIDVGKRRSPSDLLAIAGLVEGKHAPTTASIARALLRYESGTYWEPRKDGAQVEKNPPAQYIMKYVDEHPEVVEAAELVKKKYSKAASFCGPAALGAAYCIIWNANQRKAKEFMEGVNGDIPLSKRDPRWVLREFLSRSRPKGHYASSQYMLAMLIKAANLYFAGLDAVVQSMRYRPSMDTFPRFDEGKSSAVSLPRRRRAHGTQLGA